MTDTPFHSLILKIRQCQTCTDLPLGPRPIIQAHPSAKILIIGQAPGTKVHESGVPWDDASGDRLRDWLQLDKDVFYDEKHIAIMPMGLCYPGRMENGGGDKPPRKECAPLWHSTILNHLEQIELTLLVGSYAQNYYLKGLKQKTMTQTIQNWRSYQDQKLFPLPHPSWRVTQLINKNPWLETDVFPALRKQVHTILN
jgi:uracil-DNA glycosylase